MTNKEQTIDDIFAEMPSEDHNDTITVELPDGEKVKMSKWKYDILKIQEKDLKTNIFY